MIVDSTGMRTDRGGEWYEHKYNKAVSRTEAAKFHIAIDANNDCVAVAVNSEEGGDSPELNQFLELNLPIDKTIADGAYYQIERNQALHDHGITPVIPPRDNCIVRGTPGYELHDHTVQ